jgi:hypothetical protein
MKKDELDTLEKINKSLQNIETLLALLFQEIQKANYDNLTPQERMRRLQQKIKESNNE